MKKLLLAAIILSSITILTSFIKKDDKDGVIYWIDNEEKDVFISVFGARYNTEYEIADRLVEIYETDTITKELTIDSKIGSIKGCYDYYDNINQILVTFCVDKYELLNGDIYYPKKREGNECECNNY